MNVATSHTELGVALQLALDSGRVLVEAPGSPHAEGVPECGSLRNTLDTCYLLPFSSCRPTEADIIAATKSTKSQASRLVCVCVW